MNLKMVFLSIDILVIPTIVVLSVGDGMTVVMRGPVSFVSK
jgi:hypothetical protein